MKSRISIKILLAVGVGAFVLGSGVTQLVSGDSVWDQINKLKDVLVIADKFYVEAPDTKKMTEAGIEAMLKQLDPHSVYFPARQFERVVEETEGKYQGVGLQIVSSSDTIMVVEPIGGGPAHRLGIQTNDRIVDIDDSTAVGLNVTAASKKLRGPKGTKVKVVIVRPGVPAPMSYVITRDQIPLYTVETAFMIDDRTGYITVNKFGQQTADEFAQALQKLSGEGMKQLIVDLRSNPGGVLDQAVDMADLFIPAGSPNDPHMIVYTKARVPELEEQHVASAGQKFDKLPLIVLVNNASASASEIVAGAIQDWDRGLIVGETTFGKGLVQRQWTLGDGSAVRVTIARYYTPSGRLIQRDYKGKDSEAYRREAFQRDEEEGDNLEHEKDAKTKADSARPQYKTQAGRIVYGGGGVTPDYVVKSNPLTEQTLNYMRRDLYYQYMRGYMDGAASELKAEYKEDMRRFVKQYEVSDKVVDEFRQSVEKAGLKINEDEWKKDLAFHRARLKAYAARHLYSNEGWYAVMLREDSQFVKAMTLFPEAVRVTQLK